MRPVSAQMIAALQAQTTTLALCWRILRVDGAALGLTSHDRDLWHDGMLYHAAAGVMPSAIRESGDFAAEKLEVSGALNSDFISAADLEAGLYDEARLTIFLVDWESPEQDAMVLAHGLLGMITQQDNSFTVEMRRAGHWLDAVPCETTSPECRATFGDARCGVAADNFRRITQVRTVVSPSVIDLRTSDRDGYYAYGRLRILTGADSGRIVEILSSQASRLFLAQDVRLAAWDRVEVRAGCDKRFSTCAGQFSNAANFQGEPHLPGSDAVEKAGSLS